MNTALARPVVRFLNDLQSTGGLKGTDIANFTDVSKATVSRWTNGLKAPHPRTQLILSDLHYVVIRLSEYYTPEEIRTGTINVMFSNASDLDRAQFNARVNAAWEIDLWGRLANEKRAAARDADAAAADYQAARLSLAAAVAQAWFDAVEAELQVKLAQDTVRNFRDNLEVVHESFRAGLNSALDVRLERANLAGAEAELEASLIVRDRSVRSLEVLLGRYPSGELAVATELPMIESEVPAGLPAEILVRRPDVRSAALRLEASDERFSSARKNRLPGIALTASGGVSSGQLGNLLDYDAIIWSIAADLAAPVFQGGRLQAERDLAGAENEEVLSDYAQVVLVAFREVESALTAERILASQEAALEVAARESVEAEALALERYRAGLVDIITWLEARRRAFNARSSLLSVSNARLQNRIALYLALGGGFEAKASPRVERPVTSGTHVARLGDVDRGEYAEPKR